MIKKLNRFKIGFFILFTIFLVSIIFYGCNGKPPQQVIPYQFETITGFAYFTNNNGGGWSSYTNPESIMFIEEGYYRIFINRKARDFDRVEIKDENTAIIYLKKYD